MGKATIEYADFSGVNSRDSALRLPPGRSLRSKNWIIKPNGILQLRYGYTRPEMGGVEPNPIHSAAYYELHDSTRHIIYGQAGRLKRFDVAGGGVTSIGTLSSTNPWNGVHADEHFIFGNQIEAQDYDGAVLRPLGIRAPSTAEVASITVAYASTVSGSWETTSFSGHQLYMSYYNPQNGHMGNRVAIGARFLVGTSSGSVIINGLPDISGVNSEWVKLIGRTHDNGQTPYVHVDSTGSFIVVGGSASVATYSLPSVDPNAEMPTRNGMPPRFGKIAWALGRAYAIDEDDPSAIRFSESQGDVPSGFFVGLPPHSWAAASKVFFPTGERARSCHGVDDEIWVWTRNHLAILTEFGTSQSTVGRPVVRWRGTWVGGIAGHRAFAKTRYGPFWISPEKQLMTRAESGPIPVSLEYERALLGKIADSQVENIELAYVFDSSKDLDCLHIHGTDENGDDVHIVHSFASGNIGWEHEYGNLQFSTFVRNPQQVVSVRGANGKMRLWVGDTTGKFAQLEDGDSDADATYSADLITVFNAGPSQPTFGGLEWFGDSNIRITVSNDLRLTLPELDALESIAATVVDERTSLYRVQVEEKAQYMYLRVQLDSNHQDGTLDPSFPIPGVPLETYGRLILSRPDMGAPRTLGGARP